MPKIQLNDLTPQSTYHVQVRAVDSDGIDGPWSQKLSFVANKKVVPPSPVTALTGKIVGQAYQISWTAPTTNIDGTALNDFLAYGITITDGTHTTYDTITSLTTTTFNVTFDKLKPSFAGVMPATMTFYVAVVDKTGNWYVPMPSVNVGILHPNPVTSLTGSVSGSAMIVNWVAPTQNTDGSAYIDDDGYILSVTDGTTTLPVYTRDTSYTLTADQNKKAFGSLKSSVTFTVWAVNRNKTTSTSSSVVVSIAAPGAVTGLTVQALLDSIGVSYVPPVGGVAVDHYEIFFSTNGGTTYNLQYSGLSTNVVIPDTNYVATNVAVDTVSAYNTRTRTVYGSTVTPRSSTAVDATPPAAPNTVSVTDSADPNDSSGSTRQIIVSWTKTPIESDLSGYQIQYRASGTTQWSWINIADDSILTAVIPGLKPNTAYYVGVAAYDFNQNMSAYTTDGAHYPITTLTDTTVPNTPQAPTTAGSTSKIQVTCSGYDSTGTTILPRDLDYFEVYVDSATPVTATTAHYVGNIQAAATPLGVTTPIPSTGTFAYPVARTNDADTSTTKTYYASVIAVDVNGNKSLVSATSSATTIKLVDNLNVGFATITDANIQSLTATKLTAGTGIINDLTVYSTLTLGTTTGPGTIKSSNYVAGTSGFKFAQGSLEIVDGTISAKSLVLQVGANIIPSQYADFEFASTFYTGQLTASNATATIDATTFKYSLQSLKIVTSNVANFVYFTPSATTYNINAVGATTYIFSAWVFQSSGSSQNFNLIVKENSAATLTALSSVAVPTGVWTRITGTYTTPAATASMFAGIACSATGITYYVDGVQVEQKIANSSTPSAWQPPSTTTIDGGMIRTGSIQSNQTGTFGGVLQPLWSINMTGGATFANALVRGHLTIGQSGDTTTDQYIQSYNYTGVGGTGWRIDGAGTANFNGGTITGAVVKTGSSGAYWTLGSSGFQDTLKGTTGSLSETAPALISVGTSGSAQPLLQISTPNFGGVGTYPTPTIWMYGEDAIGTASQIEILADSLLVGTKAISGNGIFLGAGNTGFKGNLWIDSAGIYAGTSGGVKQPLTFPAGMADGSGNMYPKWSTTAQVGFDGGRYTNTTSGTGILTIPHAIGSTPVAAVATYDGTGTRFCTITGRGTNNISVQIVKDDGTTINGVSVTVDWLAFGLV